MFRIAPLSILAASAAAFACSGPPCRSPSDCDVGSFCVLDVPDDGSPATGECLYDCLEHSDCPSPESNVTRAICANDGRCRTVARPPELQVTEPESDTLYPSGTRSLRVAGEVATAAPFVTLTVGVTSESGCGGSAPRTITVENPNPGSFSEMPFVLDGLVIDPGLATVTVNATVLGSTKTRRIPIEVACEDCIPIAVEAPSTGQSVLGLELPLLAGTIGDASGAGAAVDAAIWRVHGTTGDVIDGVMPVVGGRFSAERIPLFSGANRVEVVATPPGGSESRCSSIVNSAIGFERGLRALMTWDGPTSDLDLHVVGPGGSFGDPVTSLSARSQRPVFGGDVFDDPEGFGPEVLTITSPPPGAYGFIVEPVADVGDPGASVFLRILYDGRLVTRGPIGPAYVTSDLGKLWVAGRVMISDGAAVWDGHDQLVDASPLPDAPPESWPPYRR